jgi:hypothetical protein
MSPSLFCDHSIPAVWLNTRGRKLKKTDEEGKGDEGRWEKQEERRIINEVTLEMKGLRKGRWKTGRKK